MPYDVTFANTPVNGILEWHDDLPSRVSPEVFPRKHGSIVQPISFLGPRSIVLTGMIVSSNETGLLNYLDDFGRSLTEAGRARMVLRTNSRYLTAMKTGFAHSLVTGMAPDVAARYTAEFVADDPFWYSPVEQTDTRSSVAASLTAFSVVNSGSVRTPVRVEFTASSGTAMNVRVTNTTIDLALQVSASITDLQTAIVDCAKFQVLNGGVNALGNFVGTFWHLEQGTNNLEYNGPTGVTIRTYWTERWV